MTGARMRLLLVRLGLVLPGPTSSRVASRTQAVNDFHHGPPNDHETSEESSQAGRGSA
jgi:hypothetical protein